MGGQEQLHSQSMKIAWGLVINLGIFLALFKGRKFMIIGHSLIGAAIIAITLISGFQMLEELNLDTFKGQKAPKMKFHKYFGVAIMAIITVQAILGICGRLLNCCKVGSVPIYYINKSHLYLGYAIFFMCKIQNFYIRSIKLIWYLLIGFDILTILIIIIRKFTFNKLQKTIQPDVSSQNIMAVRSIRQLQGLSNNDICYFSNYVYDLSPLKYHHPAGYQILELTKNRQIDRFMYGMFRAQSLPALPKNSHTADSMSLLGEPIAKISIASPYKNMPDKPFQVKINHMSAITNYSNVYEIYLQPTTNVIEHTGYSDISQIGRYYSLTGNNVTRLYTAVNFLQVSNKKLLQRLGLIKTANLQKMSATSKISNTQQVMTDRVFSYKNGETDLVPLLIKVYNAGTLPNMLTQNRADTIQLSPPKGFGLELTELCQGTVLILAGGTGLYPFSDLIDLIYKDHLIRSGNMLKCDILKESPILGGSPFANLNFKLYLAVQKLSEIHPITLKQLSQIHGSDNFSVVLRVKEGMSRDQNVKASFTAKNFQEIIESELTNTANLSKVWLCGPPKMCECITKVFENHAKSDLLLLV